VFNEGDEHNVELEGTHSRVDIVCSTVSRRVSWSMTMLLRPTEATVVNVVIRTQADDGAYIGVKSKVPSRGSEVLRRSR